MGKVIYSMSVSLDGFVETPDRRIDWVLVDEELHTFFNSQAREMAAFLYGRRMYELMVDSWSTAAANPSMSAIELEFARIWMDMPKIVFSRTLENVGWNSRLIRDDIASQLTNLKAQSGHDLSLGGPTLAATVMRLGLLDEYRLFVNPIVLGDGTPLFPALERPINLRLLEQRVFRSGVVYLCYEQSPRG